jgi:signal transduction histidine kinase/ActR/RegA family two-component response regulator
MMSWESVQFAKLVHPDDVDFALEQMRKKLKGDQDVVTRYAYRLLAKTGEVKWVDQYSKTIPYEGRPADFVTLVDITERKQAEEALQRRNRELALLNRAAQTFTSTLDLERTLDTVLEEVRRLMNVTACSVWLIDPETDELVCCQDTGPKNGDVVGWRLAPGQGIAGWVARRGESLIVPDAWADERHFEGVERQTGLELCAILTVSLRVKEDVIGVLQVLDTGADRFNAADLELLEPLVASAAIAIDNARLFEEAQRELIERRQAEEALERERQRLFSLLEELPAYVYLQAPDFSIRFANRYFRERFGDSTGEPCFQVLSTDRDCEDCPTLLVFEDDAPREWEWDRSPDGRTYQIYDYPFTDVDGSPLVLELGIDITERKRAEEARDRLLGQLQEQAQRVQQIMDTVPEGVLLLDADQQVVLANALGRKDLAALADVQVGDSLIHLAGRPLTELLTSPPKGMWHEVTMDGRSFQVIARPFEGGLTPGGWVLVIRDVTRQRETERYVHQQERLAAVGQLAAGIAHDFNNIMATIVLYAQMAARSEGISGRNRERMETIDRQAKHATGLIQQILDFSRRAILERQPLDLLPLLKEHIKLLERTLPESIEIKLTFKPGEPATQFVVNADPMRIQQAITNLALNARDAMPGGGELKIGLERIEVRPGESPLLPEMEPGEWIRISVSDTGTGISPDALPRIFEPFFTTKGPGEGSGLGLAQVHGIVGQHQGRIDVETELGQGTAFVIYLPALGESLAQSPMPEQPSAFVTGRGEIVLVVEDSDATRRALMESLELLNYRVLGATNGEEALSVLEERGEEIALVLSDVVMPRMGGAALLHALRERELQVKAVMVTGHPLEKELEDLRAQGMTDWLLKPVDMSQLAAVMARALSLD